MDCGDVLKFAPLYLAGELDPARAEHFAVHLRTCPSCFHELDRQQALDHLLRESILAEPVDCSRVVRDFRQRIGQAKDARARRHRIFTLAAIAALLVLAFMGFRTVFSPRKQPQLVYAAAAQDHRLEIVARQSRKWLTDEASIQALAQSEGIPGAAIAALAPAGYHLAQGKLCRLDRRVFVHLVYVSALGNFSVFLRRNDTAPPIGRTIDIERQGTEQIAGFENTRLIALVVTEQSGDSALRFARSAAAVL